MDSEKSAWISQATFKRLGRYVPGGGAALEEYGMEKERAIKRTRRRCAIRTSGRTAASYPEQRDEWGSYLNVLRLVAHSCDHLTNEEENLIAERVHSQLKLLGRLNALKDLGTITRDELEYCLSLIYDTFKDFNKVTSEVGFRACEETQLAVMRYGDVCRDLVREIKELEKAVEDGDWDCKTRLREALRELGEVEQQRRQAQREADKTRNDLKALVMRHQGLA
ncbi:hypothetical protein UCREL1_3920 [Eutypa lata UCREL1]|uniref:Uncharacterized protein n=1 Tax=Eutypa lata (strain UCR-EL1) TaxID=1287681 RepID=M7SXR3_EUTLA|nr:hypothetical protein UCREL1_3920 [Eutypa lata UCREL1]